MDVNNASTAAATENYKSASKTGRHEKTGKHEAAQKAPSYAPEDKDKDAASITPKDTVELSEAAEAAEAAGNKVKGKDNWKDFDMDAFQSGLRDKLMESINKSKEALKGAGVEFAKYNSDSILYDLSALEEKGEIEAADVPEYWNAENTSQRIVDFAMSFRSLASGLDDEEYIEQMREAVQKGYTLAKKAIGDLPGPSAKLFNDTYNLTMKKFDELLEQARAGKAE